MRLLTNLKTHGHNVHDSRHHIEHVDADFACRCAVHVHRRDPSHSLGTFRARIRHLGRTVDSGQVQGRSTRVIRGGFCTAIAAIGLLFAFPVNAEVLWTNLDQVVTNPNNIMNTGSFNYTEPQPSCLDGQDSYSTWTFTTSSRAITISSIRMEMKLRYNPVLGWPDLSTKIQLHGSTHPATIYEVNGDTAVSDTTTTVSYVFPSGLLPSFQAGETITFDIAEVYPGLQPGDYPFVSILDGISSTDENQELSPKTQWLCGGASSSGEVDGAIYGVFRMEINGTEGYSGLIGTDEMPESTYDGRFSELIPTIGFSTGSANYGQGHFADRFRGIFGYSTSSFPLCFVDPWINLIDTFESLSNVSQSSKSLQISGGIVSSTYSFSLNSASGTLAAIGAKPFFDQFKPFVIALGWLMFGFYIFRDLFSPKENDETL